MRNIFLIIKGSARRSFTMLILAVVIGFGMGGIFSLVSSADTFVGLDKVCIGVCDEDKSPLSEGIRRYFTERLGMEINAETAPDKLSDLLLSASISAIIKIPSGAYNSALGGDIRPLEITMIDDYANAALIKAYSETYMKSVSVISAAAGGDKDVFDGLLSREDYEGSESKLQISAKYSDSASDQKSKSGYRFAVGFMLMASAAITFYIGNAILGDRKLGTYNRMQISSISPTEYIIGNAVFGIVSGSLMNVIFLMFPVVMGVTIGVPYAAAFLLQELFVICAVGMAVMLSLLVKSQQQLIISLAVGFSALGSVTGGAWFKIDESAGFIADVSKIFPQYWFMNAVRCYGEKPTYNCLTDVAALVLFAVLFYLIAAVIFAKRKGKAI